MSIEPPERRVLLLQEKPSALIEASWRQCLSRCRFVTHYVTPEYFDEPVANDELKVAALCLEAGEVAGIATGMAKGARILCGNAGRPQFVCPSQADLAGVSTAIFSGLAGLARDRSAKLVELYTWEKLPNWNGNGFRERACKGVVMLDLSLGPEALFRGFSGNRKINIKKAIKAGVTAELTTDPADIEAYHAIRLDWSRRKGLEPESLELLSARLSLTDSRRLFVARHAGVVIAGVVVRLAPAQILEYSANASAEHSLHLRPNDLLHWRIIEWACSEGLKTYSLAGSHLFLRKFGGFIQPTYRYRLDRSLLQRYLIADLVSDAQARLKRLLPERAIAFLRGLWRLRRS